MNNYYSLCEPEISRSIDSFRVDQVQDMIDVYKCCYNSCIENKKYPLVSVKSKVCRASCDQVFPSELISDVRQCAFKKHCWDNGFLPKCLEEKKKEINECCVRSCNQKYKGIIDCKKFCKHYIIH